VLKGDLIFADEEGVPRGHPQALTLVPLEETKVYSIQEKAKSRR
jgi:hypothetical protein